MAFFKQVMAVRDPATLSTVWPPPPVPWQPPPPDFDADAAAALTELPKGGAAWRAVLFTCGAALILWTILGAIIWCLLR